MIHCSDQYNQAMVLSEEVRRMGFDLDKAWRISTCNEEYKLAYISASLLLSPPSFSYIYLNLTSLSPPSFILSLFHSHSYSIASV